MAYGLCIRQNPAEWCWQNRLECFLLRQCSFAIADNSGIQRKYNFGIPFLNTFCFCCSKSLDIYLSNQSPCCSNIDIGYIWILCQCSALGLYKNKTTPDLGIVERLGAGVAKVWHLVGLCMCFEEKCVCLRECLGEL